MDLIELLTFAVGGGYRQGRQFYDKAEDIPEELISDRYTLTASQR